MRIERSTSHVRERPDPRTRPRYLGRFGCRLPIAFALMALAAAPGCGRAVTPPATEPVLSVVPFAVDGLEQGAGYVGRAFADSLALDLARSAELRLVTPDGPGAGGPGPATEDMATRLVRGRLVRVGETVHARIELVDSATGDAVWKAQVDAAWGDLSGLARRLAEQLAETLGVSYPSAYDYIGDLTGGAEMSASPRTAEAREALRRRDVASFREAAGELISTFAHEAAAHALHAWALTLAWDLAPTGETLSQLKDRLAALDRVDPTSPYDEMLRGYVYRSSGEPDKARVLYSRVLARADLTPAARAWVLRQRSFAGLQLGAAEEARADAEEAVRLDPLNATGLGALSKAMESLGRMDDAVARARQALELAPSWRNRQRLGLLSSRRGRFDEALEFLDAACGIGRNQEACANLAVVLHRSGRESQAHEAAKRAGTLADSPWGSYNLACYRALAGEPGQALGSLRRALELGYADALIQSDPDLASLRRDPEFRTIVAEIEGRLRSRRQQAMSSFPWQASLRRERRRALA